MAVEEPSEEKPTEGANRVLDPSALVALVPEVTDLLNKALGLGAAVTRTLAQTAAPGHDGAGAGPLDEIVRNGAGALANLARLTVESLRASTGPPVTSSQVAADPRPASSPGVRAGDTLRMPLFIENPSTEPTGPLRFGALEAASLGSAGDRALELSAVRCAPETLEIGARDFEKLTVFVDTNASTPVGRHRVQIGVPETAFATTVEFEVLARS